MMGWIFAMIICVVLPVGFGTMLMSITEKIESIFGIDKYLFKLNERIKDLEVYLDEITGDKYDS